MGIIKPIPKAVKFQILNHPQGQRYPMGIHPKQKQLEIRLKCIMPMLTRDNDELQLLDIDNGVVKVRMKGAWEQGRTAKATLKKIIEIQLKQKFPEIKSVELSA